MKRILVILALLVIPAAGFLYFGISSARTFSESVSVACTNEGALRVLFNERISKEVWPGEKKNDSTYEFGELQYIIGSTLINVTDLQFGNKNTGQFIVEETTPDSCRLTINYVTHLPLQPFNRIKEYLKISEVKKDIQSLLVELKNKLDGEELVYNLKINMSRVTDSAMISTRKIIDHYPSVKEVYAMIDEIRNYIKVNGGEETSAPMLNVFEEDSAHYLVMVAVPTKTVMKGSETFLLKRMLANGYILVSEVTGGNTTIKQAEKAMQQYVTDHQKSSPAIPFQMLLNDRRAEQDTSKWKTRLYYPVMY